MCKLLSFVVCCGHHTTSTGKRPLLHKAVYWTPGSHLPKGNIKHSSSSPSGASSSQRRLKTFVHSSNFRQWLFCCTKQIVLRISNLFLDQSAFPHHLQGKKVKKGAICGILQKEKRIILLWFPVSPWHQFSPCSKTAFWDFFSHLSDKNKPFSQHCWVQFSALKQTSYFLGHTLLYSGRYFSP